eukprot:CAMPEP_0115849572 /NCGR_PEP_ID=MMETSP0287-20121206/11520_1 /TAXON_ID=412157 /ORGANISM="Chrysochromulina rotalis, Strain UIO044" /LENGTH=307 /DNA_ID=CAMNT_0003303547 /DNA_START=27 /DNA_END=950 /DNA_ORIENTATION=-
MWEAHFLHTPLIMPNRQEWEQAERGVDSTDKDRSKDDRPADPYSAGRSTSARYVWTSEIHAKFELAVETMGIDHATPSMILRHLGDAGGLTRANIKSHLQKYRQKMKANNEDKSEAAVHASINGKRLNHEPEWPFWDEQSGKRAAHCTRPAVGWTAGAVRAGAADADRPAPQSQANTVKWKFADLMEQRALSHQAQAALEQELDLQVQYQNDITAKIESLANKTTHTPLKLAQYTELQQLSVKAEQELREELSRQRDYQEELATHIRTAQLYLHDLAQSQAGEAQEEEATNKAISKAAGLLTGLTEA